MEKSNKENSNEDQETLTMLSNALAVMVHGKTQQLIEAGEGDVFSETDYFNNHDAMFLCRLVNCFKTILDLKAGVVGTVDESLEEAEEDAVLIERYVGKQIESMSLKGLVSLISKRRNEFKSILGTEDSKRLYEFIRKIETKSPEELSKNKGISRLKKKSRVLN